MVFILCHCKAVHGFGIDAHGYFFAMTGANAFDTIVYAIDCSIHFNVCVV